MEKSRTVPTRVVFFRMPRAEADRLQQRAHEIGITLSEYLRAAVLSRPLHAPQVPRINLKAAGELARIGNNLNQLARHANAGRFSPAVAGELAELRQIVKEVQSLVLGVGVRGMSDERTGDE